MMISRYFKRRGARPARYDEITHGTPDPWHVHNGIGMPIDPPARGACRFRFGGSDIFITATPAELREMADRAEKYIAVYEDSADKGVEPHDD